MVQTNLVVGLDISKKTFDVALPLGEGYSHKQYGNDLTGFRQLLQDLPANAWCIMEATGPYYLRLATFLHANKVSVSVVNPLVIKRFSQMRLLRAKTDRADARMIASYGKTEQPPLWQPNAGWIMELQQFEAVLEQYGRQRTALLNQTEAFTQSGISSKKALTIIKQSLRHLDKQIASVEKLIEQLVNQQHADLLQRLSTIPGIGNKTAITLIVITGGFVKFSNAKQISSYIGLCPRIVESGTSVKGKSRICKLGMSRIRRLLYLCSWSAIKCNRACKQMYQRLVARGKPRMIALIAVANKLLKQAFAIAKSNDIYQENFQLNICF